MLQAATPCDQWQQLLPLLQCCGSIICKMLAKHCSCNRAKSILQYVLL